LPVVTGFHLRRTRSPELAFDLTAETFAAVIVSCGRFRPKRGPAAAWLFAIAEHKLADSRRRARVESSARRRLRLEPVALEDAVTAAMGFSP
jgi:DNA-directed RNA polymerase specialized sigma24 family protein